ncbi:MAG: hypothetical protein EPO57_02685 [Chitinophagaceae bacterium]|nr:MAG: hypothetical protein EPO57_02685 [Chitinophagaceae bacterium]
MRKIIFLFFSFFSFTCFAQDTLPNFSLIHKGNHRVIVSWYNNYPAVKQISIQRSFDSLTNYKTILTIPDPMNRMNGFMDNKSPSGKIFYRIYFLFGGGNFLYTKPKTPIFDSIQPSTSKKNKIALDTFLTSNEVMKLDPLFNQPLITAITTEDDLNFYKKRKEERFSLRTDSINREMDQSLKNNAKLDLLVPTYRVIANSTGLIKIRLPEVSKKKYSIKFYEENNEFLFELKEIKDPVLFLEKSNFHHAGWFYYELLENNKLIEKQRFYIPPAF